MIWHDQGWSYEWILDQIAKDREHLQGAGIEPGAVVILEGDFTPGSGLGASGPHRAALHRRTSLTQDSAAKTDEFARVAQVEWRVRARGEGGIRLRAHLGVARPHELYRQAT